MDQFDVIIVGSGSSGGALAGRLTEQSNCSVLVLEAGSVFADAKEMPPELLSPVSIAAAAPGHPNNWAYPAEMRPGLSFPYPRGKVLGGSSSINGCYFIRGTRDDFDRWSALGNEEWAYEKVLPYYKRGESDKDFTGKYHGAEGPIPVKRDPLDRAAAFNSAFNGACAELGFPEDPDKNVPAPGGGFGQVPMNIAAGRRIGTALGYLIPALGRPNLQVIGNATVERIVLEGTQATGVEAVVDGKRVTFESREIVISAGALRSPQILMHSGIGPAAHLAQHNIGVVQDLPGVGQNLVDHPMISASWDSDADLPKPAAGGPMSTVLHWRDEGAEMELLPFVVKSGDMMGAGDVLAHPAKALGALRGTSLKAVTRQATKMRHPMLGIIVLQEDSRGSVSLASPDPHTYPVLKWNLLSAEVDRTRFRAAVRVAYSVFDSAALKEIGGRIVGLTEKIVNDDQALDTWVSEGIGSGHPSGTCRMGSATDSSAVVDQELRVHGIQGLRVADTSVFPSMVTRGPNATAMMIGERLADFLTNSSDRVAAAAPAAAAMR